MDLLQSSSLTLIHFIHADGPCLKQDEHPFQIHAEDGLLDIGRSGWRIDCRLHLSVIWFQEQDAVVVKCYYQVFNFVQLGISEVVESFGDRFDFGHRDEEGVSQMGDLTYLYFVFIAFGEDGKCLVVNQLDVCNLLTHVVTLV